MLNSFDITRKCAAEFASYPSLRRAQYSFVPPALLLTLNGKWSPWSRAQVLNAKPIIFNRIRQAMLASSCTTDSRTGNLDSPNPAQVHPPGSGVKISICLENESVALFLNPDHTPLCDLPVAGIFDFRMTKVKGRPRYRLAHKHG